MPAVAQTGNSRMAAIVTGNAEGAQKLAAFYGIEHVTGYDGYDDLLASDLVDAVYIALPNSLHADYAIRAARAGKHALVEKPLAVSEAESLAMILAAAEAGTFLMTAYRLHNEPGTVAALDHIRSGTIGDPRLFISSFSFQSAQVNHRLRAEHWGGPLQDIGVYCINAARHVFGCEPVEAVAMTSHPADDPRFAEVEATVAATLRFPGERIAQFVASFGASLTDMYRVVGTTGDITVEPGYRFETTPKLRLSVNGRVTEETFPRIDQFGAQIAYFSDCIARNEPPESDGEEGLADMRVLLAIEAAARTGRLQTISSPPRPRHPTQDMVRMVPTTDRRLVL